MEWRDVYKLPLHTDEYHSYVFTEDNQIALDCVIGGNCNKEIDNLYDRLLDKINNDDSEHKFCNVKSVMNCVIVDSTTVFEIRGWGRLTGSEFNLSHKEACRIQDEFTDWIVEQLKS